MKSIFKTKEQTVAEIAEELKVLQRQQSVRYSIFMVTYFVVSTLFLGHAFELLVNDIPFRDYIKTITWFKPIFLTVAFTGVELVYRRWRKSRLAKQERCLQELQFASV